MTTIADLAAKAHRATIELRQMTNHPTVTVLVDTEAVFAAADQFLVIDGETAELLTLPLSPAELDTLLVRGVFPETI